MSKMYVDDVLFWASLHPNKKGSFEDYICHLASECLKNSIKIRFVIGDDISNSVKCLFEKFGVKYRTLLGTDLNSAKALVRVLKENRPQLVHLNFISPYSFLILFCRLIGVKKLILTDHFSTPIISKESIGNRLLKPFKYCRRQFITRMVNRFIAVSGSVANRLETEDGIQSQKITIIYNGIDLERFSLPIEKGRLKRQLFQKNGSQFVISYIGQLIPEKGISVFMDAALMILSRRKDILFVIVGQGSQTTLLQNKVQECVENSSILFLGIREDVETILGASDVFVCPSIWGEAFGLIIAEAMACGVPVVASRVGGIPEIVKDMETGILVSPNNSDELTRAIERLLADEVMRENFGRSGRKRAVEHFSLKKMVAETIKLYQEAL